MDPHLVFQKWAFFQKMKLCVVDHNYREQILRLVNCNLVVMKQFKTVYQNLSYQLQYIIHNPNVFLKNVNPQKPQIHNVLYRIVHQ